MGETIRFLLPTSRPPSHISLLPHLAPENPNTRNTLLGPHDRERERGDVRWRLATADRATVAEARKEEEVWRRDGPSETQPNSTTARHQSPAPPPKLSPPYVRADFG